MGSNQPAPDASVTSTRKRSRGEEEASSGKITINIDGQQEGTTYINVPLNLPLHKLLKKHCSNKKMEYLATRFLYNGERVSVRRTPAELHMKDGDVINAFMDKHSG